MRDRWGLVILAAVFLLVGLPFVAIGRQIGSRADALEALPTLTAAALMNSSPGQIGTLEGRIAERNKPAFRAFVAYVRERYEGEDCDDDGCEAIWTEEERLVLPLWLDLPDGRVQIVNDDYQLEHLAATWQPRDELIAHETIRYRGLEIGHPIFVAGKSIGAAGSPTFEAEFIAGGDRAGYLADQRLGARIFFWLGLLFSLIGGGGLVWLAKSLI